MNLIAAVTPLNLGARASGDCYPAFDGYRSTAGPTGQAQAAAAPLRAGSGGGPSLRCGSGLLSRTVWLVNTGHPLFYRMGKRKINGNEEFTQKITIIGMMPGLHSIIVHVQD